MGVSIISADGARAQEVDAAMKAARVTERPQEVLAWTSFGASSGALTGLAAAAPVFSFRNLSTNPVLVRRANLSLVLTAAFTTAQLVDFGLMVARSFTASDSGGTAIPLSNVVNGKHRSSLANPTSLDARISTTGALTPGTRTLDAVYLGQMGTWAGALGSGVALPQSPFFDHAPGDYPLVLAQNEGFIIAAISAWGAGGVGRLFANIEIAEVAPGTF